MELDDDLLRAAASAVVAIRSKSSALAALKAQRSTLLASKKALSELRDGVHTSSPHVFVSCGGTAEGSATGVGASLAKTTRAEALARVVSELRVLEAKQDTLEDALGELKARLEDMPPWARSLTAVSDEDMGSR